MTTLRVSGGLGEALRPDVLRSLDDATLSAFLAGRRWFGSKGRTTGTVRLGRIVPLAWEGGQAAIVEIIVVFAEGDAAHYQLPLAVRATNVAGRFVDVPSSVLAQIAAGTETGVLYDAVEDPAFRLAMARAFARGASFSGDDARWVVEPIDGAADPLRNIMHSTVGSAEQSNTSIIFGDRAILKLFRRLERGTNPDLEIGRFLTTQTGFRGTPQLLGAIRLEDESGEASAAGMLQSYLPGSTDAWSWALEGGRADLAAGHLDRPAFAAEAERLGRVTREMHDALASRPEDSDFGPREAGAEDLRRWTDKTLHSVEAGLALLADRVRAGTLRAEDAQAAERLAEGRARVFREVERCAALAGAHPGQLIRHHGDYHLGQVLHGGNGELMVIDFEGEPARPLAERRERNSALRDVAGMLRSFAYAAATIAERKEQRESAAHWEREMRRAFLHGYYGDGALPAFLPSSRKAADAVTGLFETEKLYYELAYELNNRPDWVWIPLRAASRALEG